MDKITLAILVSSAVCMLLGFAAGYTIGYGNGAGDALKRQRS